MSAPRFWTLDQPSPTLRHDLMLATGLNLVPLVDEEAGGIVGYVDAAHAEYLVELLNAGDVLHETP